MSTFPTHWKSEVLYVGFFAVIAYVFGSALGYSYTPVLLLMFGYLCWHLYHLLVLLRWLDSQSRKLPGHTPGVWGYLYYRLMVRSKKSRKRKKQIGKILREYNMSTRALPFATIALDKDFIIQWANEAAGRLVGVKKSDSGQPITNLFREPDFNNYLKMADYSEKIELRSPVNPLQFLALKLIPYGREQFLLIARDITAEHRLEQMRHDFISNASHELRTPLSVLQGSVEQIEEVGVDDKLRSPIDRMKRQVTRMKTILQDLLTLARIEGGMDSTDESIFNLNTMLQEAVDEARVHSVQRGGHVLLFTYDLEYELNLRKNELYTAVINLLINAVNYTEAGGEIELQAVKVANGVMIKVKDTGIGVPKEQLHRLTERFYRIDDSRSRDTGGTGLGLSIVKHILDQLGSKLSIDSEQGIGSEFSFVISSRFIESTSEIPLDNSIANS